MDPSKFYETEDIKCDPNDPTVSEETIDEYNYDSEAIAKYLDRVFQDTKSRPEYMRLYTAAAALMFSENPEIGLAVLMSYDYLAWFYSSYSEFSKNPDTWSADTDEFYRKLIERIETTK
jgi:Rad3-related DNA helicase